MTMTNNNNHKMAEDTCLGCHDNDNDDDDESLSDEDTWFASYRKNRRHNAVEQQQQQQPQQDTTTTIFREGIHVQVLWDMMDNSDMTWRKDNNEDHGGNYDDEETATTLTEQHDNENNEICLMMVHDDDDNDDDETINQYCFDDSKALCLAQVLYRPQGVMDFVSLAQDQEGRRIQERLPEKMRRLATT